jgi:hypothetical protein
LADHVLGGLAPPAGGTEPLEMRFLRDALARGGGPGKNWARLLAQTAATPHGDDVSLLALASRLGLGPVETAALGLLVAVEEDAMVGRTFAYLQAPLGGSRPTLALLAAALGPLVGDAATVLRGLAGGPAVQSGLFKLNGEGRPLAEQALALPAPIYLAMGGHAGQWPGVTVGMGRHAPVPLPPSLQSEVARRALALDRERALVLRSGSPAEARAVACAIAAELGLAAAFLEGDVPPAGLTVWLYLRGLLPVFCFELGPSDRKVLPEPALYDGPVLAIAGPDGSVEASGAAAASWSLPVPPAAERESLWRDALANPELAADLARHHRHGTGRIAHLGRLAVNRCQLDGGSAPGASDVHAASWIGEGAGLGALAQPLTEQIPDQALVMTPTLRDELEALLLRCRTRDCLAEGLGASVIARYRPGVRALLVGPSGTGKTLAAGWLATRLKVPLYRVDLAAITSKYIGETEKNLAQLLARAEQSEVILLFDEADSMFGKRTEVREANDRFANAQTNYLLQRIETFDGITVLTSNSRSRFDAAFTRRLDVVIEFPSPGPEERRGLWRSHLGNAHTLAQAELNKLAAVVDLAGGHIRNVVLAAAVRARAEARPVGYVDIISALAGEYRKVGRAVPSELTAVR